MLRKQISVFVALLLVLVAASVFSGMTDQSTPVSAVGEQIDWQALSGGGRPGSSASFGLRSTIGQTAVGGGSSASYGTREGYWQAFSSEGESCCALRGDVNHSGSRDISDLTFLIDYLWAGGPLPLCPDEGDVNGSGSMDISDVTYLVDYLWAGGPLPPDCN